MARGGFAIAAVLKEEGLPQFGKGRAIEEFRSWHK
jgi:hypothetical protein